jgi:hypothetical protein
MDLTSLRNAATEVLTRAKGLDLTSVNEANTKALFIEPLLNALGWNTLDIDAVTREYPIYDGTFLDYALLVSKRPALFVEAKPSRKSLDDPKWVSQTINYANNEGVVWCVLTDGLRWRLFKANEAAPMEQKLAFEVRIADLFADEGHVRTEQLFACLTPDAVSDGELARLGTQVFVDSKVRQVLIGLLEDPHKKIVDLIKAQLGSESPLKPADLRGALARVARPAIDTLSSALAKGGTGSAPAARPAEPDEPSSATDDNSEQSHRTYGVTLTQIIDTGLLPVGTRLVGTRKKWPATAVITIGKTIEFSDVQYATPSAAGAAARAGVATNGWVFWAIETPGGLVTLDKLRDQFIALSEA